MQSRDTLRSTKECCIDVWLSIEIKQHDYVEM